MIKYNIIMYYVFLIYLNETTNLKIKYLVKWSVIIGKIILSQFINYQSKIY